MEMPRAMLGKSGLVVSRISFGCMSLGDDHAQNKTLLHAALSGGINLFDTADLYQRGLNEETVGRAFKGMRDRVIIATKGGNQWRSDGSGWDWNPTKSYILRAAEDSLRRLQTDYIDLYQLHGGTVDDPIDDIIEAFEQLKQQGKIRAYGISSIRPNVIRTYTERAQIASVMMQYSLLDRRPEETCLPLLEQHAIGVLVRGSLAGGLLIDKPAKPYLDYRSDDVAAMADAIAKQARDAPGQSRETMAIGFVLAHPAVTTVTVGIRTATQLQHVLQTLPRLPLKDHVYTALATTLIPNRYDQHR